jgi:hypothetical protein
MGRRWLAAVVMALVTANAVQVVVPAAETSPAPIAGTAPSYGPKSVSRVPNAAAIVRRIWLPELDAGYDPQGLAVDDGAIYVSAYRSDSLGVRRGPCRGILLFRSGPPTPRRHYEPRAKGRYTRRQLAQGLGSKVISRAAYRQPLTSRRARPSGS